MRIMTFHTHVGTRFDAHLLKVLDHLNCWKTLGFCRLGIVAFDAQVLSGMDLHWCGSFKLAGIFHERLDAGIIHVSSQWAVTCLAVDDPVRSLSDILDPLRMTWSAGLRSDTVIGYTDVHLFGKVGPPEVAVFPKGIRHQKPAAKQISEGKYEQDKHGPPQMFAVFHFSAFRNWD